MNITYVISVAIAACCFSVNAVAEAQQTKLPSVESKIPNILMQNVDRREKSLSHVSYGWTVIRQEHVAAKPSQQIQQMQRDVSHWLPNLLRERGVTDPSLIQRSVNDQVKAIPGRWSGITYSSSNIWRLSKDGDQIVVDGVKGFGTSRTGYRQLYAGDSSLIVNTSSVSNLGSLPLANPFAWAAPGEAVRYRCPLLGASLDLSPGHFATLMNLNPLKMYGARWTLASTSANSWVLVSKVRQGPLSPLTIRLTLSRTHDSAPSEIKIIGTNYTESLSVLGYERYQGIWVCSKVIYTDNLPNIDTITQEFQLLGVKPSRHDALPVQAGQPVEDYRLLGANFVSSHQIVPNITKEQQQRVVYYTWKGYFPSIAELNRLYQKQHPGEASPDLGQANSAPQGALASASNVIGSAMPFAGGVLLLAGGVWMFMQRRSE